jgi:rhamnosyltransferase subunit B
MVTHGTTGDIIPFVRLAAGLRDRGHESVLITHQPYESLARRAGAEFVAIDSAADYAEHLTRTPNLLRVRSAADLREFYDQSRLFEQLRVECDAMAARHRPGDTVLVGRHGSALSMLIAADLLGAPAAWVALSPSQLITSKITEFFVETGLGAEMNRVRAGYGLGPVTGRTDWFRPASMTLALWPEWFDAAGPPAPPGTQVVGFLSGDELAIDDPVGLNSAPLAALFDGPELPVLVTGGTGRALHQRFYPVAVAAAAALGRPALVVTPHRGLLPESLPRGVRWLPEVPFAQVLPRFAAIVHHGGVGTAMSALRAGVPQVIMAHGLDRPDNAGRLAGLRLARWTQPRDWTVGAVSVQLGQAVADADYRDRAMATLAGDDADKAVRMAAEALEDMVVHATDGEVFR